MEIMGIFNSSALYMCMCIYVYMYIYFLIPWD